MNVILIAVIVLAAIGLIAAAVLFWASKKFAVYEDPRIGQVAALLPQANCGGCGYPGCSGFAGACVKAADAGSLEGVACPVGGADVMAKVADVLGMSVVASAPKVAVVKCNGTCENRPRMAEFDGAQSCRIVQMLGLGESACGYGCLGCGDCVSACQFGAITIDPVTRLAVVDESKCMGCGACAKACPRGVIEVRTVGPKGRYVVVKCNNKDKGAVANKACKVACIGCGKCVKVCDKFEAITVTDNLAHIDPDKCKMCRKCEDECPKNVIQAVNFPPRKPKPADAPAAAPKAAPAAKPAAEAPKAAPAAKPAAAAPKASPAAAAQPAPKPAEAAKASPAAEPQPALKAAEAPKVEPKEEKTQI